MKVGMIALFMELIPNSLGDVESMMVMGKNLDSLSRRPIK